MTINRRTVLKGMFGGAVATEVDLPAVHERPVDRLQVHKAEREAAADRRELRIDARELVLDRWEQEIAARAAALRLLDEFDHQRRELQRGVRGAEVPQPDDRRPGRLAPDLPRHQP